MSHISNPSKFIRYFLLGAASFVAFAQAQAQDFKVAFFNGQRVLDESAPAKIASSRIEQEFSKRKKDLDDVNDRFRTAYRKYEKDAPTLSEGERLRRQRELAEMDQDFNRKQRIYNEDLAQRRQEEAIALGERALKIVRQIAEAEKIDIVLQDASYVNPRIDITDKVLKALSK
ncbi:OmpH family outer membrane protein [Undibacterium sp.]|uniref:OmpH family outer membrane protein n=1 Tax=Undibacterium sp. TaxID=1914977 RepID=UPI0037536B9C